MTTSAVDSMLPTTRGKVQLQRIADDKTRQAMFARRKQGLFKQAMELSVLCDCDVAVIVFGPPGSAGQRLYQYSSGNMDELLEKYAGAVAEPHERRRNGELLRHYYELSPDEDDMDEGPEGVEAGGGQPASAAAAAAAATMAVVDSIITGGGGRPAAGASAGIGGAAKRMRTSPGPPAGLPLGQQHAPGLAGLGGMTPPGGSAGGLGGRSGAANGTAISLPLGVAPLRRVAAVAGGGIPLEGIKAAGFLDKGKYPVSPRSERAYEEVTAAFDALTELRAKRGTAAAGQGLPTTTLQPLSSSGTFSLAAQQQHLQQLLLRQQQQRQQQLAAQQPQQQQAPQQQQQQQGGGAKRFKPLSILVPEIQTHPIIPTNLTPLTSAGANAAGSGVVRSATPNGGTGGLTVPQQQNQGLPPRPPQTGRTTPRTQLVPPSPSSASQPQGLGAAARPGGGVTGASPISPVSGAAGGIGQPGGASAGTGGGIPGGGSGGSFAFDRRSTGEDTLGALMGSSVFRTSLDGSSAAALLSMPSPPPHGGAASLFGSLDGGPLSMRSSSSHGMLAALGMGLERGASLGLGGGSLSGMGLLESPGGPMDAALRGLGPMDVLDWPSSSPRSSTGNGDMPPGSGPGGFPDEAEGDGDGDGDGGTVLDGLIVRGTALSKLAPEAREAAIGPSSDVSSGSGTPGSRGGSRGPPPHGGGATSNTSLSAFASTAAAQQQQQQQQPAGAGQGDSGQQRQRRASSSDGASTERISGAAAAAARDGAGSGLGSTGPGGPDAGQGLEQSEGERGDCGGLGMFMAAPDGLVTELSFNDLGLGSRGSAGLAAAAAAALAAAAASVQQQQQDGSGDGAVS